VGHALAGCTGAVESVTTIVGMTNVILNGASNLYRDFGSLDVPRPLSGARLSRRLSLLRRDGQT